MQRFFLKLHRMLGTLLGILFLMWFVSGLVMMYHAYPRVEQRDVLRHAEMADTLGLPLADILDKLPSPHAPIRSLVLSRQAGEETLQVTTDEGEYRLSTRSGECLSRLTDGQLQQIADRWATSGPAVLKDTLHEIDVWLIGVQPFREYPVYHYALPGEEKSELYLSSRTGEALQYTTRSSRFWAWVGAIPHWIYIKQLRAHGRQPWTDTVLWLSGIGIAMTLAGVCVGIRSVRIARRRSSGSGKASWSPYRKPLFRWHHVAGLCFGLFVLTWVFSGFMSLAQVPRWLAPVHVERNVRQELYGTALPLERFGLDYREVLKNTPVKRLTWMTLGSHILYKVETADETQLLEATDSLPRPFVIDADACRKLMQEVRPDATSTVTLLTEYDGHYLSRKRTLPLPVYRIELDDKDGSCYYLNPTDASCRYFNQNTRLRNVLYKGLHCLGLAWFDRHPLLRDGLMWLLLLGGTVVSGTGLVLGIRSLTHRQRGMSRQKKTSRR